MSVTNIVAASDEDFFGKIIMTLEAELRLDMPPISTGDFVSVLNDIGRYSPTASNTDASSPPDSPTHDSRTDLRVAMKSKRDRNRKREELETLRSTVKTLEVRLAALKARPAEDTAPPDPLNRVWEAVAMQESERRQEAERKNEELRQAVETHMQLALKLDQVIKKVVAHGDNNDQL